MKLMIDEQKCLDNNITLAETCMALAAKYMGKEDIDNLMTRGILVYKEGKYRLTPEGRLIIDKVVVDNSKEERLRNLAKQMQLCFPEGKMPGTPYYYRCNVAEVVKKLNNFFMDYGDYPDEQIIDATKKFVASYNGNYRYLPLIKYFISKFKPVMNEEGTIHNVQYSSLADFLENKEEDNSVPLDSDDWLVTTRN